MDHAPSLEMQQRPLGCGTVVTLSTRNPQETRPNEDAVTACEVDRESGIVAVADGAGGHPLPATASRIAVEAINEAARRAGDGARLRTSIMDAFERANAAVMDLAVGASTTLVAAEVVGEVVRPYHAGDSLMIVVGSRGRLRLRTVGHAPVAQAVESGAMDEDDALGHDDLNLVSNLIGMADMRIEVGPRLALQRRDTMLLASDGLFDNLSMDEIVDHIRKGPLDEAAASLVQHALQRMLDAREGEPSKPDDVSVALFRLDN